MVNKRNVRCYAFGRFGHISNQCLSKGNQGNFGPNQRKNFVCYACNKTGHVAKYCRSKNVNKNALANKNKEDNKGKEKVEEIKEKHKKVWVKKKDSNAENGSTPNSGVGSSSSN